MTIRPTNQHDFDGLAETLACVAVQRGISLEYLHAQQLLIEASQAWPGDPVRVWPKWLGEAVKSLGLQATFVRMSVREAIELSAEGVLLVCKPCNAAGAAVLLGSDGDRVELAIAGADQSKQFTQLELFELMQSPADAKSDDLDRHASWLIVEDLAASHPSDHGFHGRPIARLLALLKPERSDIWVVAVFAFFAAVLSLATPIAVESLVNIVAFGRLLQPLVILSLMLFGFLAFASMMRALQTFVVEIIQRRLMARVAADFAYRFPRVQVDSLDGRHGPELANRFFDIVTLQKVVAQLLLDGIAIVLATAVGMTVLALYHPWLLGYNLFLLSLVGGGVFLLGRGAVASGIDESKQKYRLAAWLQGLLRCPVGFKSAGAPEFALDRANQMTADYLAARQRHFRVLFRQLLFILGLQALASTVLLGFGGWLVINEQLTLGQLVAAELIVGTMIGSLAKLGKHIEGYYDLLAAVDKLGYLFDLQIEPHDGQLALPAGDAVRLRITDVKHSLGAAAMQRGFSLKVEAGEQVALISRGSAGATVLFDILYGRRVPESGHVEIEHADPRDLRPDILRGAVSLARGVEVFDGSIAENVRLGRPGVSMTDVRTALHQVRLLDDVLRLSDGLDTDMNPSGTPLLPTQLHQLMLARAIAGRPRLLLIDGTLDSLGDSQLVDVCDALVEGPRRPTLLVATNRRDVADQFARNVDLRQTAGPSAASLAYSSTDSEPNA